jgi:excisionase family DNA binding protein
MAAPEVMTKKQACQYLHISLATLERWMAAERLPVVKLGRRVLFRKAALDEILQAHERPAKGLSHGSGADAPEGREAALMRRPAGDSDAASAHEYWTLGEVIARGWTEPMVLDFLLGKPDVILGPGMAWADTYRNHLYTRQRVLDAEAQPAFQEQRRQLEKSRARRR